MEPRAADAAEAWTVGGLVEALKQLVEGVPGWQALAVTGELSGVRRHSSGHVYFTLKDARAQIRGVMFRRDAGSLRFVPQDGQEVLIYGRIGVFERDGQTQIYARRMEEVGSGAAYRALEALKQKLLAEGIFSRPKRPLPRLPRRVGLVTSPTGAARRDVETVIQRRFPGMAVVLFPVLVQGAQAGEAIVSQLGRVRAEAIDVLIIGRGGGSQEDLAVFNDEAVVRALARVPVPVISAVGHEIDTTLCDLVADLRAPTPSAAAELAVPEKARLVMDRRELSERAERALMRRLRHERERLSGWAGHGILAHPQDLVSGRRTALDRLDERAERALERRLAAARHRFDRAQALLQGLNPGNVLERGYSYVTDEAGRPVGFDQVGRGQVYQVHWYNGFHRMAKVED